MSTKNNRFCFVAPMYNASTTIGRMLHSICGQSYDNWRVILIDDVSSRDERISTETIVRQFQELRGIGTKVEAIWNTQKRWEVANVLMGISMCESDDIICRIDADDWLTDLDALAMINTAYINSQCDILWTAHRWGFSDKNISGPMSPGADPYTHPWVSSHLKTFRKRLLAGVPYENFLNMDGELVRRAGDQCIFLPALHKTHKRVYIPKCMYHYTIDDVPATYQTDDAKFQRDEALFLRKRGFVSSGNPWEQVFNNNPVEFDATIFPRQK